MSHSDSRDDKQGDTQPVGDTLPFRCEAWARRVHKCQSQCNGCFRTEYEPRLRRAEKLLREFIVTCEVHKITPDFFDLSQDVECARVYFKEETPAPLPPSSTSLAFSDDDLRRMWRAAGGLFFGPHVETGSIPEANLLRFLREMAGLRAPSATASATGGRYVWMPERKEEDEAGSFGGGWNSFLEAMHRDPGSLKKGAGGTLYVKGWNACRQAMIEHNLSSSNDISREQQK